MAFHFFTTVLAIAASAIAILFFLDARRYRQTEENRMAEILRTEARIRRYEILLPQAQSEGRQHYDYALATIDQEKRYLAGLTYSTTLSH